MTTQNPIQEKIIVKAMKDEAFRQELLNDPKAVVARELGLTLPAEANIQVLEDTPTTLHIVLPPNQQVDGMQELTDEDIEAAAGGLGYIILWTLYCRIE